MQIERDDTTKGDKTGQTAGYFGTWVPPMCHQTPPAFTSTCTRRVDVRTLSPCYPSRSGSHVSLSLQAIISHPEDPEDLGPLTTLGVLSSRRI